MSVRTIWVTAMGAMTMMVLAAVTGCQEEPAVPGPTPERPADVSMPSSGGLSTTDVVARVNGATMTRGELDAEIGKLMGMPADQPMDAATRDQAEAQMGGQIVSRFIAMHLLQDEVARQKIGVDTQAVDEALADIKSKVPEGATFEQLLQAGGYTEAQIRGELENELKIKKLLDTQAVVAEPTDAEITGFYTNRMDIFETPESVHARHILIQSRGETNATELAAMRQKAEDIRKTLLAGTNFADVARQHSDCPSKEQGGDLGTFSRGQMVKPFEDAAFTQATNVVGPVVETDFGYHIIEVLSHSSSTTRPLSEVKGEISEHLKNNQRQKALGAYLDDLKSRAKIEVAPGFGQ